VLAEALALGIIIAAYSQRWWLATWLACGLYLTHQRNALLALVAVLIVWLAPRFLRMQRRMQVAAAIAVLMGIATIAGQSFYKENSILNSSSMAERVNAWQDSAEGLTPFGRGIGSFWTEFPRFAHRIDATKIRMEFAHNELLHYVFELGVASLLLVFVLIYALRGRLELERLLLVAIVSESIFAFPLHMPVTAFVAALVAGRLARDRFNSVAGEHDGRMVNQQHAGGADSGQDSFARSHRRGIDDRSEDISTRSQFAQVTRDAGC
jgi:hypothetical protein